MHNDILKVFWSTYEDKAWTRLIDIADNSVCTEDVDTFAVQAINDFNAHCRTTSYGSISRPIYKLPV